MKKLTEGYETKFFNDKNQLVRVERLFGVNYEYDDKGNITLIKEDSGHFKRSEFNDKNKLVYTIDSEGRAATYYWDADTLWKYEAHMYKYLHPDYNDDGTKK